MNMRIRNMNQHTIDFKIIIFKKETSNKYILGYNLKIKMVNTSNHQHITAQVN